MSHEFVMVTTYSANTLLNRVFDSIIQDKIVILKQRFRKRQGPTLLCDTDRIGNSKTEASGMITVRAAVGSLTTNQDKGCRFRVATR